MIYIPVSGATLQGLYPMRPLVGDLKNFMDGLPPKNTPCCLQVSHALNMAGEKIPQTYDYAKQRGRTPSPIQVNGVSNFYLLAVDEMEHWLTQKYGAGINVRALAGLPQTPSSDLIQRRKDTQQMKAYLSGSKGILLFRDTWLGLHTEIWDGNGILQKDIDENNMFSQPRVLMWYCVS